jgi:hypothetical protein
MVWKATRNWTKRVLDKASERMVNVQPDDDDDDDNEAAGGPAQNDAGGGGADTASAAGEDTQHNGETDESKKDQ